MPFIRYSRDKRGYECTFVMHSYRPGQGPQQTRVLYLFRSPAHLKIGRKPLDDEVVEALEHTHPDLSFDWAALRREPRPEPRQKSDGRRRPARREKGAGRSRAGDRSPAPTPSPSGDLDDDPSLLGRVVGARDAKRLRAGHADLLQRIARRARTPEDRDRLTERARRLNPDEWPDEAAVAAGVQSIEAAWDAVAAELPQRRRGRRGGRRREPSRQDASSEPSGIMAEGDEDHGNTDASLETGRRADGAGGGDGGPAGPADAGTGSDVPDDG